MTVVNIFSFLKLQTPSKVTGKVIKDNDTEMVLKM